MRKVLALCSLLGIVALVSLGSVSAAGTYTDAEGRFAFQIPDGYAQSPPNDISVVTFQADTLPEARFAVDIVSATSYRDLDQFVAALPDAFARSLEGYMSGTDGVRTIMLGGYPAQRLDFFATTSVFGKAQSGGRVSATPPRAASRFHDLIVFSIVGDNVYGVLFEAREGDYSAVIEQTGGVLTSFTFLKNADATRTPRPTSTVVPTRRPTTPTPLPPSTSTVTPQSPTATPTTNTPHRLGDG